MKPVCKISGCSKSRFSRGWCRLHYMRWFRTGTTYLADRKRAETQKVCETCGHAYTVAVRKASTSHFCSRKCLGVANGERLRKFDVRRMVATIRDDACVEWPGYRDKDDYGKCNLDGKPMRAHVAAYMITQGSVAKDHFVCHRCDNPPCFNPKHLFAALPKANAEDMANKGRACRGEAHHASKLTQVQVVAIRNDDRSFRAIARIYGIAPNTVRRVKRGEIWAHV